MAKSTKKLELHKEEAKELQTTHWDMDYLSRKDLEKLYVNADRNQNRSFGKLHQQPVVRWAVIAGFGLIGLLLLSVLVYKFVS